MIKKRNVIFLVMLAFILLLPYASAQLFFTTPSQFINDAIRGIIDVFEPVLRALFGNFGGEDFLFAKMLLGILLFVIINVVIKRLPMFRDNNKSVSIIVALVISLLAIRFINENELVNGILLPYGTLGVAITTILPFMIFFYFLHDSQFGTFGRRAGWFVFGVIFLVLWSSKYGQIGPISNQIYSWTLIGMILAFIFDKNIHGYFGTANAMKMSRRFKLKQLADLEHDINKYRSIQNPSARVQHLISELEHKYRQLSREI